MKAIVTLIFVFFIGMMVHSQPANPEVKIAVQTKGIVTGTHQKAILKREAPVVRLYLFKNSRIKKELSFSTKRNTSKLA